MPVYKIQSKGTDMFENPFSMAGLFNSLMNVCGSDDPNSALDADKDPDDMHNLYGNLIGARDVSSTLACPRSVRTS